MDGEHGESNDRVQSIKLRWSRGRKLVHRRIIQLNFLGQDGFSEMEGQ